MRDRIEVSGAGNLVLWGQQEKGAIFEGRFIAQRQGQFGPVYDLETEDGEIITLASATVLTKKLDYIRIDADITVEYLGLTPSRKPGVNPFHNFRVFVGDADDQLKQPRNGKVSA